MNMLALSPKILAILAGLCLAGALFAQEPQFAPDRVIIKLADNNMRASAASNGLPNLGIAYTQAQLLNPPQKNGKASSANVGKKNGDIYLLILEKTGKESVKNALEILKANPAIEIAEPDFIARKANPKTPDDLRYSEQYALEKINAPMAWGITTGSANVVVGIMDSGIDGTHPDLIDNIDFDSSFDFTTSENIVIDPDGHGTHVAGIVGAKGNNSLGISGLSWNVRLANLRTLDDNGDSYASTHIKAISYADISNIPIINASLSGEYYSIIERSTICEYGGLFVAAAGNEAKNNDIVQVAPAGYNCPNIIAVASTDEADKLSGFSNYGESVHIAAPGSSILSAFPSNSYRKMSGTSMAAPHVAGVAALIKAHNPHYATKEIRNAIIASVRKPQTLSSHSFGILDAYAALSIDPTPILPSQSSTPNSQFSTYYTLSGKALGTIKPTTPGIYIEKTNGILKRIAVCRK